MGGIIDTYSLRIWGKHWGQPLWQSWGQPWMQTLDRKKSLKKVFVWDYNPGQIDDFHLMRLFCLSIYIRDITDLTTVISRLIVERHTVNIAFLRLAPQIKRIQKIQQGTKNEGKWKELRQRQTKQCLIMLNRLPEDKE